jgi:hypothetical protein
VALDSRTQAGTKKVGYYVLENLGRRFDLSRFSFLANQRSNMAQNTNPVIISKSRNKKWIILAICLLSIPIILLAVVTYFVWPYIPHAVARNLSAPTVAQKTVENSDAVDLSKTTDTLSSPTVQPVASKKPGYPPMHEMRLCHSYAEFKTIVDGLDYKPKTPGALDSSLQIIWGNGRFRMVDDWLTIQEPDKLPDSLRRFRHKGFGYEEYGTQYRPGATMVCVEQGVSIDVQRIRYVKGILYTMGKDAFVAVNIEKETWEVYTKAEDATSPHKEEFAKLKEYDKDNLIWMGEDIKTGRRWIPEPKPEPKK